MHVSVVQPLTSSTSSSKVSRAVYISFTTWAWLSAPPFFFQAAAAFQKTPLMWQMW